MSISSPAGGRAQFEPDEVAPSPTARLKDAPANVPAPILRVLLIASDADGDESLPACVQQVGGCVDRAPSAAAALAWVRHLPYALVVCEGVIGADRGIDLVPKLLALHPGLPIILISDTPTLDEAVRAVQAGASDYCAKPLNVTRLRQHLDQALTLSSGHTAWDQAPDGRPVSAGMAWGSLSPAMRSVCDSLTRAAMTRVPVLLRGESGTGKGLFAQTLHERSARATHPFVTINCPTLTDELLTSELFGHRKGSFTGAVRDQAGKVALADHGTLFLDELGDLSLGVQAKLLRFLQERTYERLGDTGTRHADVRIVAATNRDLAALVQDGRFREDLLYRLNVIEIILPALRDRPEDIPILCRRFLASCAREEGRPVQHLSSAAQALVLAYRWPGNIRELRNELHRISVMWPAQIIEPEAFSARIYAGRSPSPVIGGSHSLDDVADAHIRKVLAGSRNLGHAAQVLGITASTLWRKRQRFRG
jgi:NtrC-family two-component system response regulator AlgB